MAKEEMPDFEDLRAASVEFAKRLAATTDELRSLEPVASQLLTLHLRAVRKASSDFTDPAWIDKEQAFFEASGFSAIAEALGELHNVVAQFEEQTPLQRVEIELCTAEEVANLLGLANRRSVHVYRHRYDSFPEPFIEKGRRLLWKRRDIEMWAAKSGRRSRT